MTRLFHWRQQVGAKESSSEPPLSKIPFPSVAL
jgi:hypothetical protein